MIVWIAGWPHNGSTLCRKIIKQCLGLNSYSLYQEAPLDFLFGDDPHLKDASVAFAQHWQAHGPLAHRYYDKSPYTHIIKTHVLPADNNPAIVVVRDGCDAIVALSHFWKLPIRELIAGVCCTFGSWSAFYRVWDPLNRPNTILCRYEDMVTQPDKIAADIAELLHIRESPAKYIDDFNHCKKKWPKLFNDSIGCAKGAMSRSDRDLFRQCHGDMMVQLGYLKGGAQP